MHLKSLISMNNDRKHIIYKKICIKLTFRNFPGHAKKSRDKFLSQKWPGSRETIPKFTEHHNILTPNFRNFN